MNEAINIMQKSQMDSLVDAVTCKQSYLNILYLLLSFPLGVFYFVFLVTGLSLGISLLIVWVGVPVLLFMLTASWALIAIERQLANGLLQAKLLPQTRVTTPGRRLWTWLQTRVSDPTTWKGLLYLLAKFPLGILSFVVSVTLISLTVALVAAPITYRFTPLQVVFWQVDTFTRAFVCAIVGIGMGLVSIQAMNGLASVWRRFAVRMLGATPTAKEESTTGRPIFIP